jgi:hypothetical protein
LQSLLGGFLGGGASVGKQQSKGVSGERLKRVTITLENDEYPILLTSFDTEANHENIIVNKLLPLINEVGL